MKSVVGVYRFLGQKGKSMSSAKRRRPRPGASIQLGSEISPQLRFDTTISHRLTKLGLPYLLTPLDLAVSFEIDIKTLQWLCYQGTQSPAEHYHTFMTPKRQGGNRVISSPKRKMRSAQEWIRRSILAHLEPHPRAAVAYRPGLSILDNARQHCKKSIVIRIDLKDFFPSITYGRIKGVFLKSGYCEGIASMLAIICTQPDPTQRSGENSKLPIRRRILPQGACTSPDLANYVCRKMDYRIEALARSLGFVYTRYADDLVFSHKQKRGKIEMLIDNVYAILRDEGFEPNLEKTRVMRRNSLQVVTGLVVNKQPRISRRDMKRFRAIAHQFQTRGAEYVSERLGRDAKQFLRGYLSYVNMVNPEQAAKLQELVGF
jgi:RNA-directed DNA polymerase